MYVCYGRQARYADKARPRLLRLVHSSELACNKSTQLHDAFTGHARQRHDFIIIIIIIDIFKVA